MPNDGRIPMSRQVALALKEGDIIHDSSGYNWRCCSDATEDVNGYAFPNADWIASVELLLEDGTSHRERYMIGESTGTERIPEGQIIFVQRSEAAIDMPLSSGRATVTKAD